MTIFCPLATHTTAPVPSVAPCYSSCIGILSGTLWSVHNHKHNTTAQQLTANCKKIYKLLERKPPPHFVVKNLA